MFTRMLASVVFGVLVVGAGVFAYGVVDKGVAATVSAVLDGEHDGRDHDRDRDRDRERRRHREHRD